MIELAEVKKVPPKAKGKRRWEPVKPLSGLDVDSLLGGGDGDKVGKISVDNAVPDFKNALGRAEHESQFEEAAKQMGTIIRSLITDSFGNSKYERAVECMGTMREGLSNLEESGIYNSFLKDLKKRLLSESWVGTGETFGSRSGCRGRVWAWLTREKRRNQMSHRLKQTSFTSPGDDGP